jgi:TolB protein
MKRFVAILLFTLAGSARGGELAGYQFLATLVRTGDTEIFLVDPDTGDAINLTRSPKSEERYPCWSPDGKRIAFISDRNGGANLFVMDADGNNVKQIIHTKTICYMPSWAGDRIVLGMHGDKPEMGSMKPDGSDLKMLGVGHDPCLSPDGRQIAYTGETTGGVSVFVMEADGSNKRQIVKDAKLVAGWEADRLCVQSRRSAGTIHCRRRWFQPASTHAPGEDLHAAGMVARWEMDFISLYR